MWALRTLSGRGRPDGGRPFPLTVSRLLAKSGGPRATHPVASTDGEDAVEAQWTALVAALQEENSVVLFHMENHYALVFGAREWLVDPPASEVHPSTSDSDSAAIRAQESDSAAAAVESLHACGRQGGPDPDSGTETALGRSVADPEPPPRDRGIGRPASPRPAAAKIFRPRVRVRQILTAKPGQRPSVWLPFESVRGTVMAWTGHAIVLAKRG